MGSWHQKNSRHRSLHVVTSLKPVTPPVATRSEKIVTQRSFVFTCETPESDRLCKVSLVDVSSSRWTCPRLSCGTAPIDSEASARCSSAVPGLPARSSCDGDGLCGGCVPVWWCSARASCNVQECAQIPPFGWASRIFHISRNRPTSVAALSCSRNCLGHCRFDLCPTISIRVETTFG